VDHHYATSAVERPIVADILLQKVSGRPVVVQDLVSFHSLIKFQLYVLRFY